MLEYPFAVHRTPGKRESLALELLSAACSDDAHGTDYFDNLIDQYMMYHYTKRYAAP